MPKAGNQQRACKRKAGSRAVKTYYKNHVNVKSSDSSLEHQHSGISNGEHASPCPLPPDIFSSALLFMDWASLVEIRCVCQALRALVSIEHWQTVAGPAQWLQKPTPAPESFESPAQAEAYWRRWGKLTNGGTGTPSGRLVIFGGIEDRPFPIERNSDKTAAFLDVRWGERIEWKPMPRLEVARCATAAAVDRHGACHSLGGWNASAGAIDTCERLDHPEKPLTEVAVPRVDSCISVTAKETADGIALDDCEKGRSSTHVRAGTGGQWAWEALPSMGRGRCFLGAAFEPHGSLLAIGGGTGLYVDDIAFETTEVLRPGADAWVSGPSMSQRRCGLGVTALPDGKVYVAGGYGGNMVYLKSAEVFDPYSDRWTDLAPMRARRTGVAVTSGPCGRLYAVGGSANGSHGHSSVERFDPREGRWLASPSMIFGRAFCCAAFGASGCLYVVGGMSMTTGLLSTMEVFDPRAEKWRVENLLTFNVVGRPVTDAALVFQP